MRVDLDAAALVGLLADDDRRLVAAALTLGSTGHAGVSSSTGLPVERVSRALARLVDGGLVVSGDDGALVILGAAFQRAARSALARPPRAEFADQPDERRRVLDAFVKDGRITSFPAARGKRRVLLDWVAEDFEPGRRYSEPHVNAILGLRHDDTATLRRYLVDEELLDRESGEYWRIGGPVT
ncbi:MAG: DUF2087 domain-containing protein [Ilumatobacteraceae bacterium]